MKTIEIKGSKDKYYEVDLNLMTCSCRDFTYRKCHHEIGSLERLCKHLKEAIIIVDKLKALHFSSSEERMDYLTRSDLDQGLIEKIKTDLPKVMDSIDDIILYRLGDISMKYSVGKVPVLPLIILPAYDDRSVRCSTVSSIINGLKEIGPYDLSISDMSSDGSMKPDRSVIEILSKKVVGHLSTLRILPILAGYNFDYKSLFYTSSLEFMTKLISISSRMDLELTGSGFRTENGDLLGEEWTESEIFDYLGLPYVDHDDRW